jgi:hypothetical protein
MCGRLWRVRTGTFFAVSLAIVLRGPHVLVIEGASERER